MNLPDSSAPAVQFSGSGRHVTAIPAEFRTGRHPAITVWVVCLPVNSAFAVSVNGDRKFWGACSDGPGSAAGGFEVGRADRDVTLDVGRNVRWTLAITPGLKTS
jgi:hypothetical protein